MPVKVDPISNICPRIGVLVHVGIITVAMHLMMRYIVYHWIKFTLACKCKSSCLVMRQLLFWC